MEKCREGDGSAVFEFHDACRSNDQSRATSFVGRGRQRSKYKHILIHLMQHYLINRKSILGFLETQADANVEIGDKPGTSPRITAAEHRDLLKSIL